MVSYGYVVCDGERGKTVQRDIAESEDPTTADRSIRNGITLATCIMRTVLYGK